MFHVPIKGFSGFFALGPITLMKESNKCRPGEIVINFNTATKNYRVPAQTPPELGLNFFL